MCCAWLGLCPGDCNQALATVGVANETARRPEPGKAPSDRIYIPFITVTFPYISPVIVP